MAVVSSNVQDLENLIIALDTMYEDGQDCIHPDTGKLVTDAEYDQLRKRLEDLAPDSPVIRMGPTASVALTRAGKVKHNPPMTSINKAIGTLDERKAALQLWEDNAKLELKYKGTAEQWAVQAYKHDGVAIALYYEDGKLVQAGLRPRDGVTGEDVTSNARFVEGIPTQLFEHDPDKWREPEENARLKPLKITICIRGEIECRKSTFLKLNKALEAAGDKTFANPRNYAAGSIRQFTDPTITKDRQLSFTAYSILGYDAAPYQTEIERAKWCNKVLRVPFVQVRPVRYSDLQVLEDMAQSLDYEVDGVVISVNNLEDSEQLGTHGNSPNGNPKGKIAWKFAEESVVVNVQKIVWNVGRTGKLTPVLSFDPVQLAGTTVGQCTGHNLGFLERMGIGAWTEVRIIKSGKIIPKVVEVVGDKGTVYPPYYCPSCQEKLEEVKGPDGKDLVCHNEQCGVRAVNQLCHYLATLGVKGVAESVVSKLHEARLVLTPADFYELKVADLIKLDLSERQALLACCRIHMIDAPEKEKDNDKLRVALDQARKHKKQIPAWQVFAALGVGGAGRSAGRALVSHFGDVEAVIKATVAELEQVEDVGTATAQSIKSYFQKYGGNVRELLKHVSPTVPRPGKLSGKTFVFTGGFPDGKSKWQKEVEDRGGKVAGSVSSKVDYVVVGTDAGSKATKATELGVAQLTLAQLEKML